MISLQRYPMMALKSIPIISKQVPKGLSKYFQTQITVPIVSSQYFFAHKIAANFCSNNNHSGYDDVIQKGLNQAHASSQNKNSIFTSKHYEINNDEIITMLNSMKMEFKVRPSGQIVAKYCPFCPKPHNNSMDNMYTLNFKPNSGAYFCFRCGSKGSWFDFKNNLLGDGKNIELSFDTMAQKKKPSPIPGSSGGAYNAPEPQLASESLAFFRLQNTMQLEFPEITNYLIGKKPSERHLSQSTLEKFKIGMGMETFMNAEGNLVELPCVYFPMFAPKSDKSISKIKRKEPQEAQQQSQKGSLKAKLQSKMNEPIESEQVIELQREEEEEELDDMNINNHHYVLVRNKIRAIYKENKSFQRLEPSPGVWGLFGLNTVSHKSKVVVITEGEYDAMAVYEATKMPAISLPNGANHLPLQVLPWLEKFERIYLWMDADLVGQQNAQSFAQKLGISRVHIVNTRKYDPDGPKDANDALRMDPSSIERYILEARPITQENITTFQEMKDQILNRILRFDQNVGIQSDYFKWFNKKLKGFRRGEMTIVTGGTGSGKTSLLSQLSLDFAKQGVGTMWGSFEVKNEILMTNMLLQYSGVNLYKQTAKFEHHAENFEKIPIYYLKFFGSHTIDKIINTIEYGIYAFDIGHVIIDNLQFLLSGQGRGFERFDIQDEAIARFRELATTKNVHITVVIHPKKVDDNQDLTVNSVFGSAKATQEADNIIIIQNRPKYRVIDIKKNRFDGDLGRVPLGFDRDTKRFFEITEAELFDLHRNNATVKEIIDKRKDRNETFGLEEASHEEQKIDSKHLNKMVNQESASIRDILEEGIGSQETDIPESKLNTPIQPKEKVVQQQQQPTPITPPKTQPKQPSLHEAKIIKPGNGPTSQQRQMSIPPNQNKSQSFKNAPEETIEDLDNFLRQHTTDFDSSRLMDVDVINKKQEDSISDHELHQIAGHYVRNVIFDESIKNEAFRINSQQTITSVKVETQDQSKKQAKQPTQQTKPSNTTPAQQTKPAANNTSTKKKAEPSSSPAKKKPVKKAETGKSSNLYGDLYNEKKDEKSVKDTFYTNEDREEVREKLEQFKGMNKKDYKRETKGGKVQYFPHSLLTDAF